MGLAASTPFGFSNGYALGMLEARAKALGIETLSDLAKHPALSLGLSHEFLRREDGWPGLRAAYGLKPKDPRGLDHGIAYEALAAGQVEVIDLYTTDAKIARLGLRVLADDRRFFPRYDAVILHRIDAPARHPRAFAAWAASQGRIDEATMIRLNGRAELDRVDFAMVAGEFLGAAPAAAQRSLWSAVFAPDFARLAVEHVALVFGSLAAAIAVGVPAGIVAARVPAIAQPLLAAARCSPSSSRSPASGRGRRWSRSFSTACCPSCETRTRASWACPAASRSRRWRSASRRGNRSRASNCRSRCPRSWRA
jgi:osmoprotectant transport system permease protein